MAFDRNSLLLATPGPTGPTGYTPQWLHGSGAPSSGTGANSDMYTDTASSFYDFYGPKTAGAWGSIVGQLKGPQGTNSSAANWRGAYNPVTAYAQGDGVTYSGFAYVGLRASTGQQPDISPADWQNIGNPGIADPGANGLLVRSALNTTRPAKADDLSGPVYTTASGTNTLTATLSPAVTSYVSGTKYRIKAAATNTGAVTIAINGLSAVTIKKISGGSLIDLDAGDITANQIFEISYDGTFMQLSGVVPSSSNAVSSVATGNPWIGTPSTTRAIGSVYQNPSATKNLHVFVTLKNANLSGSSDGWAFIGATSSPGVPLGYLTLLQTNNYGVLYFLVPPSWFYKVFQNTGSLTYQNWDELL